MKSHPLGYFFKYALKEIDDDPKVQLKIHTWGFYYWTINFPIIALMFFFYPAVWAKWGLFITLIYSIYANWTSDYTGMSSSQSVINTQSPPDGVHVEAVPYPGTGVVIKKRGRPKKHD